MPKYTHALKGQICLKDLNHMSRRSSSQKKPSLEQCQLALIGRLYWLVVAWLIAVFTLAILSGLHLIVLPSGLLHVLFGGTSFGLFRLFSISQRWLFQIKPYEPLTQPQSKTPVSGSVQTCSELDSRGCGRALHLSALSQSCCGARRQTST